MIFDEVFHALTRCLAGLALPFKVPGTDQLFKPKIFITILAYSSIIGLTSHQVEYRSLLVVLSLLIYSWCYSRLVTAWVLLQVLVQGCQLDQTDLDEFLHLIYDKLRAVENNIAEVLHQQHEQVHVHIKNIYTVLPQPLETNTWHNTILPLLIHKSNDCKVLQFI